jgi:hypothetical protein
MTRHVGCGTENPFAPTWLIYGAVWSAALLSGLMVIVTGSWWWELGWLLMPVLLSPSIWWELRHSPGKMYRTWWP